MKTIEEIKRESMIEQLKIDLKSLNERHDLTVGQLKYINTEIKLLEQELKIELHKESPFISATAMARLLGNI